MNGQDGPRRNAPDIRWTKYLLRKAKSASNQKTPNDACSDILIQAFKRLDPNGTLVPGTPGYVNTEAMVIKWIRAYGPGQALEMVERSVKIKGDPLR